MHRHWLIWNLIPVMWIAWCLYWILSARDAKRTVRRESLASRASHVLPLVIGVLLVALPYVPSPLFATRILPRTLATYGVGVTLVFLGLAFAVWARLAAILGTAVARGELRGVWALALCTAAFVSKLRIEERWMRQVFGEAYERYSARVPALIPLFPR